VATFDDNPAVLTPHSDYDQETNNLQQAVNKIIEWTAKWKIQVNSLKSARVDFPLPQLTYNPTFINSELVNYSDNWAYDLIEVSLGNII